MEQTKKRTKKEILHEAKKLGIRIESEVWESRQIMTCLDLDKEGSAHELVLRITAMKKEHKGYPAAVSINQTWDSVDGISICWKRKKTVEELETELADSKKKLEAERKRRESRKKTKEEREYDKYLKMKAEVETLKEKYEPLA